MSRKKMRSKADEFEMDEAGYDEEYGDAPAEQHIYDNASGAEPEHRAPKAKKKKRKKGGSTALWLILVLLLVIVGGGVFAGYEITQSSANLPNVYVGSIAVGKLDAAQTRDALTNQGWETRVSTPLKVTTLGGQSFEVDPVKAGAVLSVDDAVSAAHAYGHSMNIIDNLFTYIKALVGAVDINAESQNISNEYIDSCINEGISAVNEYMGTEEYTVDAKAAEMTMKKGWGQIEFDKAAFREAIIDALEKGETELSHTTLAKELSAPDFDAIHKELEHDPVDAYYSDDGKFEVTDEIVGCKFDVSQAEKLWNDADPGDEVKIPLDIVWPEVTGDELRGRLYRDLLGTMTTKFPNSGENRRSNLELATSKIDGMIMYPGDEFSYNEVVGQRTEEAGFLPAPAYVDGDVKDEIGGGACQVSSTLYAATLFSFLETVERECHYFPVNYMQMGTDATVTIPEGGGRSIDFKFRNSRNYPIKLVGIFNNEESTLTFEIWGTLEDDDYMPVEFDSSYSWVYDFDKFIDPAYPDRDGYTIKLTHETYSFEDDVGLGYRTLTHRQVIDADGNIVVDEITNSKLSNGNYAMDTYYQHN